MHKIEVDYVRRSMSLLKPYFLNVRKIFWSFTSVAVFKCSDLVQKRQTISIVISNFNSHFYDMEPRVNKQISFNLFENMLTLFTTVRSFSYDKSIKEKQKIKSNKSESRLLRRAIKKSSFSKDMGYWMLYQSQLQS